MRKSSIGLTEEKGTSHISPKPTVGKYFTGLTIGVVVNIFLSIFTGFLTIWLDGFYTLMVVIPVLGQIVPRVILPRSKDILTSIICMISSLFVVPTFTLILHLHDMSLESLDDTTGQFIAMMILAIIGAWLGFINLKNNETKMLIYEKNTDVNNTSVK